MLTFSHPRRAASALAAAAIALVALSTAAPASAHDSVVSTSPAEGATVSENPGTVSVTLSAEPLASESMTTSQIEVTAPDGHVVSSGKVEISGATVSIDADIDHEGEHTVAWRSVSADGHPIEGTFAFTYAGEAPAASAEASAPAPAATAGTTTAPTATASAEPQDAADAAAVSDTDTGSPAPMLIIGGIILIAAVAAGAFLVGRKLAGK
jgi:methionine-rich copper-binding protein CopC